MKYTVSMNQYRPLLTTGMGILVISMVAAACSNSSSRSKTGTTNPSTSVSASPSISGTTYKINNVLVTTTSSGSSGGSSSSSSSSSTSSSSTSGSNTQQMVRVFLEVSDSSKSTIASQCTVAAAGSKSSTGKGCLCAFEWQEINPQTGQNIAIRRNVKTNVSTVQPTLVECNTPPAFATEVSNETQVKLSIIPAPNSSEKFTTNKFTFSKSSINLTGDFQDAEGRSFSNIHRYTCYEQFKKGITITNKSEEIQDPAGGSPAKLVYGTQFCIPKDSDSGTTGGQCQTKPENSAQAYYYNLYIRSNDIGGINAENSRYKCPLVKEPLSGITNVGAGNYFWPLDSQFSLAINPSGDFVVAVEGYSKLGSKDDPNSKSSSCLPSSGSSSGSSSDDTKSILKTCLGFAGKPKSDGTCPAIKTASGQYVFTYRLRRYIVLYPPLFKANGYMMDGAQPSDTVYVLDRPILPPNASFLDPNSGPISPYTMLGPKPCPFSFFDHQSVAAANTQYVATNNSGWDDKNVDGTKMPTADTAGTSCSATLPYFNSSTQRWSLVTTQAANNAATLTFGSTTVTLPNVYIRPQKAWAPVYVEDTDFQACAPQSQPLRDPPLHFAKNLTTGNVGYCAAVYPTQNPNATAIGTVVATPAAIPHTSPIIKNAAGSACVATTLSQAPTAHTATFTVEGTTYDTTATAVQIAAGMIDPSKTCDRTVMNVAPDWPKFPLQARPIQIESALRADSGYECTVVYDNGNTKSTNKQTPKQGCCGTNVYVWTGLPSASIASPNTAEAAHFEPNSNLQCLTPSY